jgi:hypothetical protein
MLKKALFISLAASALVAGQYATLKDGKTIILHDNGTWEEVTVVKSSNDQVAVMAAKDLAGAPKAVSIEEPLARMLVGEWKSRDGELYYNFRNDGTVTYTIEGSTKTEGYTVQFIDSKDNTISVSIGDSSRYGKVVFGGLLRKFKISKDGKSAVDYSDEVSKLITVDLKKIGDPSNTVVTSSKSTKSSSESKPETLPKNGFVK